MAGSIQERGNGKYLLTYHVGYDHKGKRIRRTRTVQAKNDSEAGKKLALFVAEIENKEYVAPSHIKFGEYVKVWRKHAAKKLSPGTLETYDYTLNGRILPTLAYYKMESITHVHISGFLEDLEEGGLSSSSIQKYYNVLSNIFKLATIKDVIKHNPMAKVDKPSVTYTEGQVYTPNEVEELFQVLDKEENKQQVLLIKLALKTGMRKGELLALQWNDFDFVKNMIHIKHSLSYTKENGYVLKEPKTKGSVRKVSIPQFLIKDLRKHINMKRKARMDSVELWEAGKYEFVFSADLGKPLYPSVPNRWWTRFLKRTGFKKIRFHDLRHTFATGLISKGGNINKISKYLGHASITTTMDTYGHYLEDDKEIADLINENVN